MNEFSQNQRITNALLLNGCFTNNLGLLNGKLGISIVFYHLARQTGSQIYENYAEELIDEIFDEINTEISWNFADGLTGIGWGIEYLVQNKFLYADADEVLNEIDLKIAPFMNYFPTQNNLGDGLLGIGTYLLKRIKNSKAVDENMQFKNNKQLLINLIDEFYRRTEDITEIFAEPSRESLKKMIKILPLISGKKIATFDLTWDYPLLIAFFSELFQLNLYNNRVCSILERLLDPLTDSQNWPTLQSNRLLLVLALQKLIKKYNVPILDMTQKNKAKYAFFVRTKTNIEDIIRNLFVDINRERIAQELKNITPSFKNGITGIFWIYQQLYNITKLSIFKVESEYWHTEVDKIINEYLDFVYSPLNEKQIDYGLINGFAGLLISIYADGKN
jgi:lantibiotic modifying enzyme